MADKRVVLVTGVSEYWGARVAAQLMARDDLHVIGLDEAPPKEKIKGLDFIEADIRNPVLMELLQAERVDTVCHLAFMESARANEAAFDLNVMGTMKVLGACAEAGVRKVVLKSSTMVYGAQASNSAFLREDAPLHGAKEYDYIRSLVEIEAFANGFRRQQPEMVISTLRCAHIVGPTADTPMTRFLRDEEALVLMGFDPMMQVIHEDDVVSALAHAVLNDVPGVFNVAAEGNMPLWKVMGLAGKLPMPTLHPVAYLAVQFMGPRFAPIALDYLRYPCVGDLAKLRAEFGFAPQYTAAEALREFASKQRVRQYMPESITQQQEEERLRDVIERRRRAREHGAEPSNGRAPRKAAKARQPRAAKIQTPVEETSLINNNDEENGNG